LVLGGIGQLAAYSATKREAVGVIQRAHPLPTGGANKPLALPALRPERVGELHPLMDACNPIHRKDELERVGEHRDGYGGLIGAFVGSPHPVIL